MLYCKKIIVDKKSPVKVWKVLHIIKCSKIVIEIILNTSFTITILYNSFRNLLYLLYYARTNFISDFFLFYHI